MAVILATDFGPHPPSTYAQATADQICPIDASLMGDQRIKAEQLRSAIAERMMPLFTRLQEAERENLTGENLEHILSEHDANDISDEAVLEIQQAAENTDWGQHYKRGDVIEAIKFELARMFVTAQHVERLWHADRNPDNEQAQQYRRRYHQPIEENNGSLISESNMNPLSLNQ
jgi:hypothetical protein